jgi:hypothetical protein
MDDKERKIEQAGKRQKAEMKGSRQWAVGRRAKGRRQRAKAPSRQ